MTDYEQNLYKQFSQEANRRRLDSGRILEEASNVAQRHTTTTITLEQATSYKRIQLIALEQFAKEQFCWFEDYKEIGVYLERGGENEVYYNPFSNSVFKLNDFTFAGDDAKRLFDRINVHNHLFANVAYSLIGFTKNSKGLLCAILEQAHIQALREATESEIVEYMKSLGFTSISTDEFSNELYEVFDAVPNNVLMGIDGNLYFFDTQIKIL
jgi:hypothetical protein